VRALGIERIGIRIDGTRPERPAGNITEPGTCFRRPFVTPRLDAPRTFLIKLIFVLLWLLVDRLLGFQIWVEDTAATRDIPRIGVGVGQEPVKHFLVFPPLLGG
jgi:hypothetical protein